MAESTSEYHHGDQDISAQISTYHAFGNLTKWGCLTIGTLLVMLVMWFCTDVGFVGGLVAGLILAVAGVIFLRDKPDAEAH